MVWGSFFPQTTCYVEEKQEENSTNTANENAFFHVEMATGTREKWQETHAHVVTFAFRVSR